VFIQGSLFQNNFAADQGGAIYGASFVNLSISGISEFMDNFAISGGSEIYLLGSTGFVNISKTDFSNKVSGDALYLSQIYLNIDTVRIISKIRFKFLRIIGHFDPNIVRGRYIRFGLLLGFNYQLSVLKFVHN